VDQDNGTVTLVPGGPGPAADTGDIVGP
jgi:hypothetical protein